MAVTCAPAGVAQHPVDPQSQQQRQTSCAGEPTAPSAQRVPYGQSDGCTSALGTKGCQAVTSRSRAVSVTELSQVRRLSSEFVLLYPERNEAVNAYLRGSQQASKRAVKLSSPFPSQSASDLVVAYQRCLRFHETVITNPDANPNWEKHIGNTSLPAFHIRITSTTHTPAPSLSVALFAPHSSS
ncbi:hypothetical protein PCANC_25275 [Puccinia coronata f. sp. avenae]|uniref:Uncharacterized protein n=1 Tax=Puccinia coronata f. sp. avenae TaxID=200324 RepID=A0A2N5U535_9BASI|nr:hypothetical protein PCANC_25275 [Puccinia coronata f. sp. avenae]